uniref:MANSC domain-containing protein n=1 Tax=Anopheles coluzzii TaxID=1518534 RepID=A0A8W7PF68_ANOCL
ASTPKQAAAAAQQCGHFEFPCHSGECIAVYNVCDGIPQCEDGSDEGAECPQKNDRAPLVSSPGVLQQGREQGAGLGNANGGGSVNQPIMMIPSVRGAINEPNYVDTSDSHIFNHKGGLQLSPINGLGPASQQYQESLPEPNYMPSSSVIRGGGGGKSYLTLPGSNGYPQQPLQQFPPEQPQQLPPSSYKSILPSQWMGSNSVRSNWPMQPGDGLPSGGGSDGAPPQEQYIQPPVQQHRPVMQELQSTSNGADAASSITMQQQSVINQPAAHPSGAQWGLGSQMAGGGATPTPNAVVVPGAPAAPGAAAGEESNNRAGSDTPAANNNPAPGHESLPSSGATAPDSAKHKPPASNPSGGGAEYEEDAYEDTYPESTNAAGGEEQSQPPTQTEPPKKKLRKHHKHGKQGGGGAAASDSDLDTANEQQTEQQQKKKKKTKTIKKDKAAEHGAGSGHHAGTDPIVHEHLKALHKDLEIEFADHDGYADRPGGAMLSLTLGVLLTAAMGILLSCRMRVARRRIRRPGKSSYAHDADFLVNGMYL